MGGAFLPPYLNSQCNARRRLILKRIVFLLTKKVSMKDYFNVQFNHTIRFILWRGFIWKCNRLLKTYRKGKLDAKIACPFSGRNIKAKLGVLTIQFEDWLFSVLLWGGNLSGTLLQCCQCTLPYFSKGAARRWLQMLKKPATTTLVSNQLIASLH